MPTLHFSGPVRRAVKGVLWKTSVEILTFQHGKLENHTDIDNRILNLLNLTKCWSFLWIDSSILTLQCR